jgi:MFS transporter, ACS family, hexuronate transporter
MSKVRWWMLALLFFGTTVNYLDRIVLGFLLTPIRAEMQISNTQYGDINAAFQLTYTFGFLLAGKLIDVYGTRKGYLLCMVWWTIAAALHSLANSPMALGACRMLLGLGESGNFPAAMKSVSEWFPRKERAFATGIFNAGTNVATMIGPPVFHLILSNFSWRTCFLFTSLSGVLVIFSWVRYYRLPQEHSGVDAAELAHIQTEPEPVGPKLTWAEAARRKETWGFALAKAFSDPVWWFYLFWLPPYLSDVRKLDLKQAAWALPFIYLMADIGSVAGGWLSSYLIRKGWNVRRARFLGLGISAACMPFAALSVMVEDLIPAILLISLATAAHQSWSANLFTTTTDFFPRSAVASVTGIGGFVGGLSGFFFSASLAGRIIDAFGYTPMFLLMGCFHIIGFTAAHLLMPKQALADQAAG